MDTEWEPPRPGQWALDRSHLPGGSTLIVQELMRATEPAGTQRMLRELGAPIDYIDVEFVHGWMYTRLRPLVGGDKPPTRQPPVWLLKALVRLHPEMRRRARRSAEVLQSQPWLRVIDDWHHGMKDEIERGNLELQDVDLDSIDDAAVLSHLRDCFANCTRTWETHFWLHGYDLGPLGRYLYESRTWGVDPAELLSLLEGASPSTSGPAKEAASIRAMVGTAGARPTDLATLRAVSPAVDEAVERYLRHRAWVLFSRYDVDGVTLGERPDLVFSTLMAGNDRSDSGAVEARTAAVRARVPAEARDSFDELLRQARAAMDLRDDNGPTTAEWPLGLVRRALLELGRRMEAAGKLDDPSLSIELHPVEFQATELAELPEAETLIARRTVRGAQRVLEPPRLLGPPEAAPPLEVLPAPMRTLVAMVQTVMQHLGMDGDSAVADPLAGTGIGSTPLRALARVAVSPEDALDRLQPGEILVVTATTPAYNLVLSMAGGLVTAEGGPMSHAAVIARELGIPAVVGARGALTEILDGAAIEIDPAAGRVIVVGEPAAV